MRPRCAATRAPISISISMLVVLAIASTACGGAAHDARVVAWPPRRDPHVAVAAPSPVAAPVVERAPEAPWTRGDRYEEPSPGVHVREGEAHGIGFLEVVLGEVDPEEELPLVVVIHGRGDRPRVPGGPFAGLSRAVRVVMPRGPMILGAGFGWLPVRVADGQTEVLAAALRDVSARLALLIDEVRATRRTRGPTIVTGFSQGAMLTLALAVLHREVVGVAFPLAGWLPPPLRPTTPPAEGAPAIRSMHARDDDRIPYAPSLEAYEQLRTLGWDLELATYDGVGHAMSPEMDATFHGWLDVALEAITRGEGPLVTPAAPLVVDAPPDATLASQVEAQDVAPAFAEDAAPAFAEDAAPVEAAPVRASGRSRPMTATRSRQAPRRPRAEEPRPAGPRPPRRRPRR